MVSFIDMKISLTSVPGGSMPRVLFNKTVSQTPSTPHPGLPFFALLSSFASSSRTLIRSTLDLNSRRVISTPTHAHRPCLSQSPSFALPNCAKLFMPCSLRSMFFSCATSWAGARLTRWTMMVGSVSRMTPSSTISSIASERRS